eukprot:TRINITY_DN1185_c0_g1_i6.p1 TRINITY_DN1185_c0_g1~~TRINITY_DN1185_c0_g1_i6.p1  ORF type:complete len:328 (-),score=24.44 TRINITY_DN1185_c0_g1_i6:100-1083(-)
MNLARHVLDPAGRALVRLAPHVQCHPNTHDGVSWLNGWSDTGVSCRSGVNHPDSAYLSAWYITPQQHIIETIVSLVVLAPLVGFYYRKCSEGLRAHAVQDRTEKKRFPVLQKVWGGLLLLSVVLQLWFKWNYNHVSSHPAYLAQPCHVHSVAMALTAFSDASWSRGLLHVSATLWWGPFLAFVAPDLPASALEVVVFWIQHTLMLCIIIARVLTGSNWMCRDFWWNTVGYVLLTCYHFWFLAPVSLVTGINVATMMVPPDPLETFGAWYRPAWTVCCGLLHLFAVSVVNGAAALAGVLPAKPRRHEITNGNIYANGTLQGSDFKKSN